MKLHEDGHSVTSISDVGNNIYVGSHKRNVKAMIVNSSNSLSRGESGERANLARSYSATIYTEQQQVHKIKSKCYLNVLLLEKKMMLPR